MKTPVKPTGVLHFLILVYDCFMTIIRNKALLTVIIAAVILIAVGFFHGGKKDVQNPADDKMPYARVGGTEIPVEIARTGEERAKGLSGRPSLEPGQGMLFIFPEPGNHSFWMPDMNFPIDIIWITDGKVVGIEKNVSNEFDPKNPEFFTPPRPVKYVLEVNAGFADSHDIGIGNDVIFHNIE